MPTLTDHRLARLEWDAAALVAAHPPRFRHPNKLVVQGIACPPGSVTRGSVIVSRWRSVPLPEVLPDPVPTLEAWPGFFTCDPPAPGWLDWHLNFADPQLFGFYAGGLFAQDEMQVSEHPVLASVPPAMEAAGVRAVTVERGEPTPVLVAGAERRCVVDTEPDLAPGRIEGLYGNRFGRASEATIRSATRRLDPPTISNILAIAALSGGSGRYRPEELRSVLTAACTGFAAARAEATLLAPGTRVAVHTGFWGCGAFGGDRVLMTTLQAIAARLAGVHRLVFHYGDSSGRHAVEGARREASVFTAGMPTADVLAALDARAFVWGRSDGN